MKVERDSRGIRHDLICMWKNKVWISFFTRI